MHKTAVQQRTQVHGNYYDPILKSSEVHNLVMLKVQTRHILQHLKTDRALSHIWLKLPFVIF